MTVPPDFNFSIIRHYLADMQFVLLVLAIAWTALILRWRRADGIRQVAFVAAGNLLVNLAFFHEPSRFHALLYNSSRHAFAVELAVCLA